MATQSVIDIRDRFILRLADHGVRLDAEEIEELEGALDDAYTCGVEDGEALAEAQCECC